MWRADLLEKSLLLRKTEGRRRRGQGRWDGWMASLTQWTEFEQGDSGEQKSLVYFSPWDHKRLDVTWWLNSNNKLHPYPWLTVINIARYIQKFIQPLWRTVWRFLKKLKIDLPYDSAISLTGWEKTIIQKDRSTQYSLQCYSQQPGHGSSLGVHWQMNGYISHSTYTQWDITQP